MFHTYNSSVSKVTGYSSSPGRDLQFLSSPPYPDWPWGLPSLLSISYLWLFPQR